MPYDTALARAVWNARYRLDQGDGREVDVPATLERVARSAARLESRGRALWSRRFTDLLASGLFIPGGRILAGAGGTDGKKLGPTLANCFVMTPLTSGPRELRSALLASARTLRAGGGIGLDFSGLRSSESDKTGPVAMLARWDQLAQRCAAPRCRRGAVMATLRDDHPDLLRFIDAKLEPGVLTHCNCSVLVSDALLIAVRRNDRWLLHRGKPGSTTMMQEIDARALWQRLARAALATGEPGVLFRDHINRENNLGYRERLTTTNPCAETPLPNGGACLLGSFNLALLVRNPWTASARFDYHRLELLMPLVVRFMDNLIDQAHLPLPAQRREASLTRRLGIGVMGLGSALTALGLRYGSSPGRTTASNILRALRDAAYASSVLLADERSAFPAFDPERYPASPFVERLPDSIRRTIARRGIRNSHLLACAPTGSIALLADNVSCGIEPSFGALLSRRIRSREGLDVVPAADWSIAQWPGSPGTRPPAFETAYDIDPPGHLAMLLALQPWVDQGISKTIPLGPEVSATDVADLLLAAGDGGAKGVTVFRQSDERPPAIL
ncbi:MAG: ribonucleotide reductase N-terminal alpha domain-containing protein [Pseudomonadales bacterium]